jgi:hypothetical protein
MNINSKTTISKGEKTMNTNPQNAIKESKMKITTSKVIGWAGLAAMASGILFASIQPFHPADVIASVTTARWAIIHCLSIAMDIFGLLGIAGLYARQVEKSGWLGLAGYLLFSLFWASSLALHFIEVFIYPLLATNAPKLAQGLLGIVSGAPSEVSLGALPAVNTILGIAGYALGGLLFAIASFRARVLPRWASVLLAVSIVLPFFTHSLVKHPYDRIFAVPVGAAIVWLGYALWSERRQKVSEPLLGKGNPQAVQTGAN